MTGASVSSGGRRVHVPGAALATLAGIVGLAVAVGEIALLKGASAHAFLGNSDGATVVLEGQSIAHGNVALGGWDLSLDSFWTLDAQAYALAVAILGVRPVLLNLVPAGIATAVVLGGMALAAWRAPTRRAAAFGAATVAVILALPSNALAYFLLQGPWHVTTTLACLAAFAAVARGPRWWSVLLAACCLATGLLGDTQTVLLGCAPVVGAGVVAAVRQRSWREVVPNVVAVAGAFALAYGGRALAVAAGSFHVATGYPRAHAGELAPNVAHIFSWGSGLLGHGAIPTISTTNRSAHLDLVRIPEIAAVAAGVLVGVALLVSGAVRGRRSSDERGAWRIEDLLIGGLLGDLVLFVILTPNDNGNYARYLTAGLVYGVILAARVVGRATVRLGRRGTLAAAVVTALVAAVAALAFARDQTVTSATQEDSALVGFLTAHRLDEGLGDYWSASITTVDSSDHVRVRPVITDRTGQLVRFGRQSSADWYQGVGFQFVVYDTARPWRRVGLKTATATFGAPARTYAVGTYRVLVFPHPLHVSTVGYSRG